VGGPGTLTDQPAGRTVRGMDEALSAALAAAIEELGHRRFGRAAAVRDAKRQARAALIAFGQQQLTTPTREAATNLGACLDDMAPEAAARAWEPLLHAFQELERRIAREHRR
jgi:hypothetical protein